MSKNLSVQLKKVNSQRTQVIINGKEYNSKKDAFKYLIKTGVSNNEIAKYLDMSINNVFNYKNSYCKNKKMKKEPVVLQDESPKSVGDYIERIHIEVEVITEMEVELLKHKESFTKLVEEASARHEREVKEIKALVKLTKNKDSFKKLNKLGLEALIHQKNEGKVLKKNINDFLGNFTNDLAKV
jgi:hypothetical protein